MAETRVRRTMLLAHHVWEATPDGATADEETFATAYDRAMEEESESFRAASETLSANERKVVTRIATGVETMNTRSSAVPLPRSSVSAAVASLRHRAVIAEDPASAAGLLVIDPLFSRWIRAGRRPD